MQAVVATTAATPATTYSRPADGSAASRARNIIRRSETICDDARSETRPIDPQDESARTMWTRHL
jgi:hypothetical protein